MRNSTQGKNELQEEKKGGLTAHQNNAITDAICRVAQSEWVARDDGCAETLTRVRRALVDECEAINQVTRPSCLTKLRKSP